MVCRLCSTAVNSSACARMPVASSARAVTTRQGSMKVAWVFALFALILNSYLGGCDSRMMQSSQGSKDSLPWRPRLVLPAEELARQAGQHLAPLFRNQHCFAARHADLKGVADRGAAMEDHARFQFRLAP